MFFIMTPAPDRAVIERLADLPKTDGGDGPLSLVKVETNRLPIEPQKLDQPATFAFKVLDESFVIDLDHVQWQQFQLVRG